MILLSSSCTPTMYTYNVYTCCLCLCQVWLKYPQYTQRLLHQLEVWVTTDDKLFVLLCTCICTCMWTISPSEECKQKTPPHINNDYLDLVKQSKLAAHTCTVIHPCPWYLIKFGNHVHVHVCPYSIVVKNCA